MAKLLQLLGVVQSVFAVQGSFSRYEPVYDDWLYDVGKPSTNTGGNSKCKKDLLLVVDTSFSIGEPAFEKDVKPFLESLVRDPVLNVGEDGTQIGLIIFSHQKKTKKLLNFGDIYDADQLALFMRDINWEDVSGGHTRTDIGLEIANEMFPSENPSNNRPSVDDVVVIITDGAPRGRSNTLRLTQEYADELKQKGILVVGAAVGSDRFKFKHVLEGLATSAKYVLEADFEHMDDILTKLVANSCIKPSQCTCNEITSEPIYIQPGHSKAVVEWPIPQFTCKAGRKATVKDMYVEPQLKSPHSFSIGVHVINYTFKLKGSVTVTCPVTVTVKGELCRGKAFASIDQVCCCGTVHSRKPGYECCGPDYFNSYSQKCCRNANLISSDESCPGN